MTFEERLRDSFEQMMTYRYAVGYATATYRSSVPPFIDHCARNYADSTVITQEMVDNWLTSYPYSVNSKAAFISLLREYTKYLHFSDMMIIFLMRNIPQKGLRSSRICSQMMNYGGFLPRLTVIQVLPVGKDIFQKWFFRYIHGSCTAAGCVRRNLQRFSAGM